MRSRMYDLSQFGKTFKETFGRIFRRRRPWCGNLWEGRFKSTLIGEAEYLRICTAYVELNPVRAGLSTSSSGYEWCTTGAAERGNAFAQRCRERLAAVAGFGDSNCKFQVKFYADVLGCGILSQARQRMEKTGRRMRGAGGREEGRRNRTWSGILRRFPPSSGLGVELRGFWLGSRDEVRVAGYPV